MSDSGAPGTERERGEVSREGFGNSEAGKPSQKTGQQPNLTPPAERATNRPTHPARDDGLGEANSSTRRGDEPVPPGDPQTESDRSDIQ